MHVTTYFYPPEIAQKYDFKNRTGSSKHGSSKYYVPLLIIFAIFHTDFVKNLDFLQTMLNGPKELLIRMEAYLSHHGTLEGKLNNFCIVR